MATIKGLVTTYNVSENKVDVSPVLSMLKLPETPLLNQIGISGETVDSTRYEWWDDVLPVLKTTLASAYTSGGNSITVAAGTGINFRPGDIIRIESSIYRVTAVNTDTLTIVTVSGDANHDADVDVELIGNANAEAAEYQDSQYVQKVKRYNMTQIFTDYVKFSGTQLEVSQYVNEDVFLNEVQRKLEKLRILMERTAWLGVRVEPSDNTAPRLMGGIKWFIEQEGITSTTTFSEANFTAFLKQIFDAGGIIREAWMNPATKANFNALNEDKLVVERADSTAGRLIKTYLSDYGDVEIKTSPHIPANIIIVLDTTKVKVKPLKNRQMKYEQLAKTGDYIKGQIVGEYTLEFRNPDVAGIFTISG